jgi:hypothetical protein
MVAASKMRKAQQAALAGRPYAQFMNKVLAEVASETREVSHPFIQSREGDAPVRHPHQHRQGPVRRPQQQPHARGGQVRKRHPVHRRRPQRLAIPRPHQAPHGRRIHLQGRAALQRSPRHFQVRRRPFPQGRSGPRGHPLHQLHFHARAKTRSPPTPAHQRSRGRQSRHGRGQGRLVAGADRRISV